MQEPVDLDQEYAALIASARLELEAEGIDSDPNVPPKIVMLARRCAESTDYPVKAIVRRNCTRYEPDGPVTDLLAWHAARLEGKPVAPPVRRVQYEAWVFIIGSHRDDASMPNAVCVETWLRSDEGYSTALAISPNAIEVCPA